MPRLGRTAFIRKHYRWSLNADQRKPTPREVEAERQAEARRMARGSV